MAQLNENLAAQQKITQEQRDNLDLLYEELSGVLARSLRIRNDSEYKMYACKVKEIEFKLQENWNFPQDPLFHTWWNKLHGCTCPKIDNDERFGSDKIVRADCPYHGNQKC